MTLINAKEYLKFKTNPNLAMFGMLEQIKKDVLELVEHMIAEHTQEMEKTINERMQEIIAGEVQSIKNSTEVFSHITSLKGERGDSITGPQGIQGERGEKGDMGPKPLAGIDYPIPKDGKQGIPGKDADEQKIISEVVSKIPKPEDGKDGKDGSPDKPLEIADKLNTLTDAIDQNVIKGLTQYLNNLQQSIRGTQRLGGGGGGSGITVKTPTETPDTDRTIFTVISQPKWVVSDGVTYYENNGYTYASGKITMTSAPNNYIRYYV